MREALKNNCDLFVENYYELRKNFRWSNAMNIRLGALICLLKNCKVDVEAINRCRRIIDDNTGTMSQFRDITKHISSVLLSVQEDPEAVFQNVFKVYQDMKKAGYHSSPYLVLAAFAVVLESAPEDYLSTITSARSYYNSMKKEHRFITSSDDYCYSALLAIGDKSAEHNLHEMEVCFDKLQQTFTHSNAIQSLSHVLTLSKEDVEVKCKRVQELYHALRKRQCRFGLGTELSFIGLISLLKEDIELLADEIAEVNQYLGNKKGFGIWSLIDKERIIYSIAIVFQSYMNEKDIKTMEVILANSVTGMIKTQHSTTVTVAK